MACALLIHLKKNNNHHSSRFTITLPCATGGHFKQQEKRKHSTLKASEKKKNILSFMWLT